MIQTLAVENTIQQISMLCKEIEIEDFDWQVGWIFNRHAVLVAAKFSYELVGRWANSSGRFRC